MIRWAMMSADVGRHGCTTASHEEFRNSEDFLSAEPPPRADSMRYPWGEFQVLRNCPHCGSTIVRVDDEGDFDAWEKVGRGEYIFYRDGKEIKRSPA